MAGSPPNADARSAWAVLSRPLIVTLLMLFLAIEAPREPLAPQTPLLLRVRGGGGGGGGGIVPAARCGGFCAAGEGAGAGVLAGARTGACDLACMDAGGGKGGLPLDLRVMILSMASSSRKRAAVRLASLPTVDASAFRVGYLFLLTRPPDEEARRALAEENATFGDLHFADDAVLDADLAMKVWRALGEAAARADAPFFLKLDDDHMVFYDRLLAALEMLPRSGLLWGRRGSGANFEGDPVVYTNNAYLLSKDVLQAVAADAQAGSCSHPVPGEDYCTGRSATGAGGAALIDDNRWHNDDEGLEHLCLCRHWTLEDETSIVVHHVKPQVMEAFATNKTRFAEMRFPDRNYARR